jgi:hypothetical protein
MVHFCDELDGSTKADTDANTIAESVMLIGG